MLTALRQHSANDLLIVLQPLTLCWLADFLQCCLTACMLLLQCTMVTQRPTLA